MPMDSASQIFSWPNQCGISPDLISLRLHATREDSSHGDQNLGHQLAHGQPMLLTRQDHQFLARSGKYVPACYPQEDSEHFIQDLLCLLNMPLFPRQHIYFALPVGRERIM